MLDETRRRRADFLPGAAVRLADGQLWTLPAIPSTAGRSLGIGPDYEALVDALGQAEDEFERARGELALVVFLLTRNYDLTPADCQSLLLAPCGGAALVELRSLFREIAEIHARAAALARSGPREPNPMHPHHDDAGVRQASPLRREFPTASLGDQPG